VKRRLAAGLALAALVAAGTAGAAEIEGVAFADRLTVGRTSLGLRGTGLLRKFLIKGYVAALYMADDVPSASVLSNVPKRLEIEYFRSVSADAFAKAGDQYVARNVDAPALMRLRPRLDQLNTLYRDVEPGDRYSLTYVPGWGTELSLNGEPLGRVPGADFAAAVFSIWLGEDPMDEPLKRRLLTPR
jgi:hypothetical protein